MTEGTSTFEGLSLPRLGEYEQVQQDPTIDMVTLTASTGASGDFIVAQDCSGGEVFVVSTSGLVTAGAGVTATTTITGVDLVLSGSLTGTTATFVVSATTQVAGVTVSVTSSGAEGLGVTTVNGFAVVGATSAFINAAFAYLSPLTTGSLPAVGCATMLMSQSSVAPDYFLSVNASGHLSGALTATGFLDDSLLLNTFTCGHPFVGVKCVSGSAVFYLLGARATGIT